MPFIFNVSIPQAVGTIAIDVSFDVRDAESYSRFNTASGRYYCNRPQTS